MSKVRMYILAAAVATAGIGLGGTFGASAVPINGKLIGATAPAPELHKVYYYADITGEPTTEPTTVSPTVVWLVVATATVATAVASLKLYTPIYCKPFPPRATIARHFLMSCSRFSASLARKRPTAAKSAGSPPWSINMIS